MARFCTTCGAPLLSEDQRFCHECGFPVGARYPQSFAPEQPERTDTQDESDDAQSTASEPDIDALISGVYAGPVRPPMPADEMRMVYAGPPAPVYAGPFRMGLGAAGKR